MVKIEKPLTGPELEIYIIDGLKSGQLTEADKNYRQGVGHVLGSLIGKIRNHREMDPEFQAMVPGEMERLKQLIEIKPDAYMVFEDIESRNNIKKFLTEEGFIK